MISALAQVSNELASAKVQNGRLVEANNLLALKFKEISESYSSVVTELHFTRESLARHHTHPPPTTSWKEGDIVDKATSSVDESRLPGTRHDQFNFPKQTSMPNDFSRPLGLPRPVSCISLTSSAAELAEFDTASDYNPGWNSARNLENDGESPAIEGLSDSLLLGMRDQNYKQRTNPDVIKRSISAPQGTKIHTLEDGLDVVDNRAVKDVERIQYLREIVLKTCSSNNLNFKNLRACYQSINCELGRLDEIIASEDSVANCLTEENCALNAKVSDLEQQLLCWQEVVCERDREIQSLKEFLAQEEKESDEIAGLHEEEIGELIRERDQIASQCDHLKEELGLSITNREIMINIEHQAEILDWKYKYDQLVATKESELLDHKQQLIDLQHAIEHANRELSAQANKYEHQISTLKQEFEHMQREKKSYIQSAERKYWLLEHSIAREGLSLNAISTTSLDADSPSTTPMTPNNFLLSHLTNAVDSVPTLSPKATSPISPEFVHLDGICHQDSNVSSPDATSISANTGIPKSDDANNTPENHLDPVVVSSQSNVEIPPSLDAPVSEQNSDVDNKLALEHTLNAEISDLMLKLEQCASERLELVDDYESRLRQMESRITNDADRYEATIFEYEQKIEQLKYEVESALREKESLVLAHSQELDGVKHSLEQAVNERELIAIEYLQLMQSK